MPLAAVGLIHGVALFEPGLARNTMPLMLPMYTLPSGAELMLSGYRFVPSMTMSGRGRAGAGAAWVRATRVSATATNGTINLGMVCGSRSARTGLVAPAILHGGAPGAHVAQHLLADADDEFQFLKQQQQHGPQSGGQAGTI